VSYQEKGGENLDTTTDTYIAGRHVEYLRGEGGNYLFGYNDAMGCPMFSTSVVLPYNGPQVKALKTSDGFMLTQDYRNPKWPMACNYRYENRFEFYNDGAFRIVGVNKGRGCGDNAIYRPVMRIDMAVSPQEKFYSFEGTWKVWEHEASHLVPHGSQPYPYKIVSSSNTNQGYYIEPNHGQFADASRGDNATIFVTKFHEKEGDQDLLTLGSCCNLKEDSRGEVGVRYGRWRDGCWSGKTTHERLHDETWNNNEQNQNVSVSKLESWISFVVENCNYLRV